MDRLLFRQDWELIDLFGKESWPSDNLESRFERIVREILKIKESVVGNILAVLFLLTLSAGTLWFARRQQQADWFVFGLCLTWLLCCYFPLHSILKPKISRLLIDARELIWAISDEKGNERQEKVSLKTIATMEVCLPEVFGTSESREYHRARLFLITNDGKRVELPSDLYPGVYRQKIADAIKQYLPDLKVVERQGDHDD